MGETLYVRISTQNTEREREREGERLRERESCLLYVGRYNKNAMGVNVVKINVENSFLLSDMSHMITSAGHVISSK